MATHSHGSNTVETQKASIRNLHHEKWFRTLIENSSDAMALLSSEGAFFLLWKDCTNHP